MGDLVNRAMILQAVEKARDRILVNVKVVFFALAMIFVGVVLATTQIEEPLPVAAPCTLIVHEEVHPGLVRDSLVLHWARYYRIDPRLALGVAYVENPAADSLAISRAGAVGLMQVMPKWWAQFVQVICQPGENLFDRSCNVNVGVFALRYYLEAYGGDVDKALRGYNGALRYPSAGDEYTSKVYAAMEGLKPRRAD